MNSRITTSCLLLLMGAQTASAGEQISFNRDIRPILSDRCFACHGPDEETRAADLRLDNRESATSDSGGHPAIAEGDAAHSELIRRVTSSDSDEVMPPPEYGKPLTSAETDLLKKWINQGAAYDVHWSLKPLLRPAVPAIARRQPDNPIDAFVQARLAKEKMVASATADPRIEARRLAFDLTGLPPQPEIVEKFVSQPTDEAYAKLVDEFLESPHYGERMAMYWLDLVRYADTLGYHGDQPRSVSPYRDYVIGAFNQNKSFRDFTTEQLAGDLLPNASLWQKVATTYNRLNRASGEGGVQPKEYLAKYSADRVRTTGAVWLGSTFGCAECHDHKFDPFTTRDFYSFAAFFADIKEQGIVRSAVHIEKLPVPTSSQAKRLAELSEAIRDTEERYKSDTPELLEAKAAWEHRLRQEAGRWTVLNPLSLQSAGGAKLAVLKDQSILAGGTNPERDVYVIRSEWDNSSFGNSARQSPPNVPDKDQRATDTVTLRLELLPDKSLPKSGPGRAGNGNLVLHSAEMTIDGQQVVWQSAAASHSQANHAAHYVINGHKHGWAILPRAGQPLQLLLSGHVSRSRPTLPVDTHKQDGRATIEIRLKQNHGSGHNIGRFRLSVSSDPAAAKTSTGASEAILKIAAAPSDKRTSAQTIQLDSVFRQTTSLLKDERDRLQKLRSEHEQLTKSVVTTLATTATQPRTIRVLPRGNWMDDTGDIVEPAVPHFLPQAGMSTAKGSGVEGRESFSDEAASAPRDDRSEKDSRPISRRLTRLDLAHWLTNKDNPLVARTFVNRLWMLMFGHGLSRSVDDLGSQGEPPTHPELLDWLAVEFIESGWDVKHIIRLLVTSKTYRQSSQASPELLRRDPYNRLYARQSRWRLEAEMIRDNALSVSGLLNPQVGGVSAKPYQPAGYWAQLNFPRRTYQHDKGQNQYRRGVYTHWQRTFLHPGLLAFDAPAREECTAQRPRSNTPLQSLVLLNDPTFLESARVLATQVVALESSDFTTRLRWLTRQTLMRLPRDEEAILLQNLFAQDLESFRKSPANADRLIAVGQAPVPENIDHGELAAWTGVARAILNLHESITRY